MKKFLPLIIVILIAIIFSILALYTSNILTSSLKVVEGNDTNTVYSSDSPNSITECTSPTNLTGYIVPPSGNNLEKGDKFQINGLQCDSTNNYYGSPTAEECAATNTPYSLKGCHKILIKVVFAYL